MEKKNQLFLRDLENFYRTGILFYGQIYQSPLIYGLNYPGREQSIYFIGELMYVVDR